ncbi:MAG: hypothetical protein ACP5OO_07170, partial [Chloroflexia bacterium]
MKSRLILRVSIMAVLVLALTVGLSRAQGPEPPGEGTQPQEGVGAQALVGTAFTYQGYLKQGGNPYNGNCDFRFSLWDAETEGTPVGATQSKTGVPVSNGFFTIPDLDFGADAFPGETRWLEIAVKCAGDADYTTLAPRQALTAAPYALGLRPGATVRGPVDGAVFSAHNTTTAGTTYGVYGRSDSISGIGVFGYAADADGETYGVIGQSDSSLGVGVFGRATAASGNTFSVYGRSASTIGRGVYGHASATGGTTYGVYGRSDSTAGYGVYGYASATDGVTYGVYGRSASTHGTGVFGRATATGGTTYGVVGLSESNGAGSAGVRGWATATATGGYTYGVYGRSASTAGYGVFG